MFVIMKGFLSLRFLVAGIGTHDIDISKQSDLEKYPVIPATLLTLLSQFCRKRNSWKTECLNLQQT